MCVLSISASSKPVTSAGPHAFMILNDERGTSGDIKVPIEDLIGKVRQHSPFRPADESDAPKSGLRSFSSTNSRVRSKLFYGSTTMPC